MEHTVKPNFFIVGAPKSGTTNMSDYLQQHPEVFIPENQEPWFFARMDVPENFQREIISNEHEYLKLFNNGKNSLAIGESSPVYLACPHAPQLIKNFLPNAKILISLRNPIEIAYSQYLNLKFMKFHKNLTFKEMIDFNKTELEKNQFNIDSILVNGFYFKHLRMFMESFPPEQIKIIIFEDYIKNSQKTIQSIFSFLNLKEFSNLTEPLKNSYRVPTNSTSKLLMNSNIFRKLSSHLVPATTRQKFGERFLVKQSKRPPIPQEERKILKKIYEDDVSSLKKMIHMNIPWKDFT